jgi:hypothetical protein
MPSKGHHKKRLTKRKLWPIQLLIITDRDCKSEALAFGGPAAWGLAVRQANA